MLRAAWLDPSLYREVAASDKTGRALAVVLISALATSLGLILSVVFSDDMAEGLAGAILLQTLLVRLASWMAWSLIAWLVGARLMTRGNTSASFWSVARAVAFAYSPSVLFVVWFLPILGGAIGILVYLWLMLAGFIAIRESMSLSGFQAFATVLLGNLVMVPLTFLIPSVLID